MVDKAAKVAQSASDWSEPCWTLLQLLSSSVGGGVTCHFTASDVTGKIYTRRQFHVKQFTEGWTWTTQAQPKRICFKFLDKDSPCTCVKQSKHRVTRTNTKGLVLQFWNLSQCATIFHLLTSFWQTWGDKKDTICCVSTKSGRTKRCCDSDVSSRATTSVCLRLLYIGTGAEQSKDLLSALNTRTTVEFK